VSALILAALLLLAGSGFAAEPDLPSIVGVYLKAREQGTLGSLAARAYAEPTRPDAPPTPNPSVSVVLLPYAASLEAELDAAKAGLRDSLEGYVLAVSRVETARVDYERALLAAGGGELVRTEVTDDRGAARLGNLPAGEWLVLAWREGGHLTKHFTMREPEARHYPNVPTNVTYSVVTYWRLRVTVRPAETVEINLHDRNVWMTAARQEGGTPVQPQRAPGTQKRR
jgi:hypothetical protein